MASRVHIRPSRLCCPGLRAGADQFDNLVDAAHDVLPFGYEAAGSTVLLPRQT
jgi:hypothetical protein